MIITGLEVKSLGGTGTCVHRYSPQKLPAKNVSAASSQRSLTLSRNMFHVRKTFQALEPKPSSDVRNGQQHSAGAPFDKRAR